MSEQIQAEQRDFSAIFEEQLGIVQAKYPDWLPDQQREHAHIKASVLLLNLSSPSHRKSSGYAQRDMTIGKKIRQFKEFLTELVNDMEQASQQYGTTDLEIIAAHCGIPHEQLLRLFELLTPMTMVSQAVDVAGECSPTALDSASLSGQEQELIRAWRDAAAENGDELSISQDLALEFLKRRY